jgi:hypothetical protein
MEPHSVSVAFLQPNDQGEHAMRHAGANHASSYWLATLALCIGLLPAGATFAQQEHFPPTAFIVTEQDPPGPDWQVVSGIWSPVEGTFRSSGGGAADISTIVSYQNVRTAGERTTNLPYPQFTYRVRMFNEQASPSSELGVVYQYQDPANYYEVAFSTPGGVLSLRRVINGVVTTLATSSRGTVAPRTWYEIEVRWNAGRTTVKLDGALAFFEVVQNEFTAGQVGLISHGASGGRFDQVAVEVAIGQQPFKEDFSDGIAQGWSPVSGQWAIAGGTYNNAAVEQTNVTFMPIDLSIRGIFNFTIRARMLNPYSGSGNLVGLTFGNSEVVFSPTGIARINRTENGVRTTIASATYNGRSNTWFDVWFEVCIFCSPDGGARANVWVDGQRIFQDVPAAESGFGLITHWAPGRFDDVWFDVGPVGGGACTETFSEERVLGGGWNTTGGTLNSTAVAETDILAGFCSGGNDVTYRMRLLNRFGASGNLVGLIYNRQSSDSFYAGDYFEVVLSPTGRLEIRKFIHGVRYVVARGTHTVPRNVWFNLEVIRNGINTTVKVNGSTRIQNVPQGELPAGAAGAVTHWSNGRFDDLSAVPRPVR